LSLRIPSRSAKERLTAPRIFINVGGRAVVPPLQGIEHVPFLTNTSMLALDRMPEHLIIIGGSYVGLEFEQMYRRFGAAVTVVEMGARLVAREDEDTSHSRNRRRRGNPRHHRHHECRHALHNFAAGGSNPSDRVRTHSNDARRIAASSVT
jgi:pyruvate/2-oxoglutarate dehydrogenase complex dihydrolipoamide dehydrogenase (E3) component